MEKAKVSEHVALAMYSVSLIIIAVGLFRAYL